MKILFLGIVLLSINLFFQGCTSRITEMVDYPDNSRFYYRYFNDTTPPIIEFYVLTEDGFLIDSFDYDSNGDWYPDKTVIFSGTPDSISYRVATIPKSSVDKLVIKSKLMEELESSTLTKHKIQERLTEAPNLHPANKTRFESDIYRYAKKLTENGAMTSN